MITDEKIESEKAERVIEAKSATNQHDQHMALMNLIRDDNDLRRQELKANSENTSAMRRTIDRLSDTLDALAIGTQNMVQVAKITAQTVHDTHKAVGDIAQTTEETQVQVMALATLQDAGFVDIREMITSAVTDIRQALFDINAGNERASKTRHDATLKKVDSALIKLDKIIEYTKPPEPKPSKEVQPNFKPGKPAPKDEPEKKDVA